jgi:lysozyme family protein
VFWKKKKSNFNAKKVAWEIVGREGGYVNDPDDPGGATKWGITIGTLRRVRGSNVTVEDVKNLTQGEAVDIFLSDYFYKPKINKLPESIQDTVFDMQVNSGNNAIKILQRTLREFGQNISVDGVIGPKTIAAAFEVDGDIDYLRDAYGMSRREYYFRLGDKNPKLRKFARTRRGNKGGWIKRAEEFISPEYHLTDEQFRDRIRRW